MVEQSQYATTTKYIVKAHFDVQGVVEKPDVVGAVFGQTEGLFGPDLDLRELQKSGRIGRIEINLDSKRDKTTGSIVIPSSLDKVSTAIIAAAIESVDRIGPCEAKITLEKVEDVREEKRNAILTKAKDILRKWVVESSPSTEEVVKEVASSLRGVDLIEYGPEKLPAGPEVESGSLIVVEGRADVILLMTKEIMKALRERVPINLARPIERPERPQFVRQERPERQERYERPYERGYGPSEPRVEAPPIPRPSLAPQVFDVAKDLRGTLEAVIFDEAGKELGRMPVSELAEKIPSVENAHLVLFDGVVTQRLLDIAAGKNIRFVIGDRVSDGAKKPPNVNVMTLSDLSSFSPGPTITS